MSLGTLTDLAQLDGMPSYPSLARFIATRNDFPVIQHGQYGKPFILDLDAAAVFVREHWRDGRNERRRRRLAAIMEAAPIGTTGQLDLFDDAVRGRPPR
ncbi:hypothetical protein [Sphingomonas sp. CV7422]|uniref:hypothetical protein n=1 Tax=Sphingomonas sp. CV7422 TaxID=3018036 RepID=UPI0022FF4090|nr:hypothetical protein [Sphingomonas sp. CV7422]